ncbi:cyclic nucleotide-binding domain-containing protein [Desulforhopalus sp. IMCC35007]|uniref:cyclic nucleotide-binding domain-containing protein n=1 Tax=Desulforhopalus sp. IMCC35007 TaxID=2569543 RepID=UPI0010AEC11F|nr:cyclic nucleotide-binding domain-containing protein [Desulforhopalus sp. IMCC35007]TKB06446.1 cyclic nucleotide-binding domain-containing protein [Desulforhopalus sp. IMCC35007]
MSSSMESNKQPSEMQENLALLQELDFFSALPLKAIKLLAFVAERQHFSEDETIFEEGDDYGRAYIILSGELTLMKKSGNTKQVVQHFHQGNLLGTLSLLGVIPSLFLLKAGKKSTVLTISREHYTKIQEQFPETTALSLKALIREVYQWERKNLTQAQLCCLKQAGVTIL